MSGIKSIIVCVACAAVTDIANSAYGLSYWWAVFISAACLLIAGYAGRRWLSGKGPSNA